MRRFRLSDEQWDCIKDCLPGQDWDPGCSGKNNQLFVEAVLYRYRTGMPWADLPERFGDYKNIHLRHLRWAKKGVWSEVFFYLAQDADNEYTMIDSTVVRGSPTQFRRSKKKRSTKSRKKPGRLEHKNSCYV